MRTRFKVLLIVGGIVIAYLAYQLMDPSHQLALTKDQELTRAAKQSYRMAEAKARRLAREADEAKSGKLTDASLKVKKIEPSEVQTNHLTSTLSDEEQKEAARKAKPNVAYRSEEPLPTDPDAFEYEQSLARENGPKICSKDKAIPDEDWNKLFRLTNLVDLHLVQPGETLETISKELFNTENCWPKIWAANPEIKNPHELPPGTVIHFRVENSN